MEKKFVYAGFNVKVIYKKIKHTYMRTTNEEVVITTSLLTPLKQIEKLLLKNEKKLKKMLLLEENANKIYYKGKGYEKVKMSNVTLELFDDKILYASENVLKKWYQEEVMQYFKIILDEEYQKIQEKIPYPELKIRKMKTRWGVCDRMQKKITLNTELMRFSDNVIRYVIIHELSHFVFKNHDSKFWELVAQYCPNYKGERKKLRN